MGNPNQRPYHNQAVRVAFKTCSRNRSRGSGGALVQVQNLSFTSCTVYVYICTTRVLEKVFEHYSGVTFNNTLRTSKSSEYITSLLLLQSVICNSEHL